MKILLVLFSLLVVIGTIVFYSSGIPSPTKDDVKKQILRDITGKGVSCQDVSGENRCSVDTVVGRYAKGLMPQAYWIAVQTGGTWTVVITGNGIPQCAQINRYQVPKEIYGNCIESSGQLRF